MRKKLLLLGSSGKMGSALWRAFEPDYEVTCRNSKDFDAFDPEQVRTVVEETNPDIVINSVAFMGIELCEKEPERAFSLNALFPKQLALLSARKGFLLVHFSTDAVFNGEKGDFYLESDAPRPLNIYGASKYAGDCFVGALAERHYIARVSLLFGETKKDTQFVEKMLLKARSGQDINVADDIVLSPTYSEDAATEIKKLLEEGFPFGLYHVANEGKATLYELMKEIAEGLGVGVSLRRASHREFAGQGVKNTYTPLGSEKIQLMRPWRHAVMEYCERLKHG